MVTSAASFFIRRKTLRTPPGFLLILSLFVGILITLASVSAIDTGTSRLRIVFEMTSEGEEAFDALIANVEGLQKNSGTLANISVVAFAQGVGLFRTEEGSRQQRLVRLADRGVDFAVCQTSLKAAEMTTSDLLGFVRTVRSGSEEIESLVEQGWARVPDGESYVSHL